ncbi:hypothetical protein [Devosia sp.]|uniref:hypothetical protein n=1 Tax=Devosia sp. TaxID=1871048 RepID=UPI003A91C60A
MSMPSNHPGRILPQDLQPNDGGGEMLTAQPVSQSEVEELLYGDDRPASERVARLQEIAALLQTQHDADFGEDDPGYLLVEVQEAIGRLSGDADTTYDASDAATYPEDASGHRETLSPDSDELAEIELADEASVAEDIGEMPERGVH